MGTLLTPKPHFNQPQPSALGDFRFPTAQEGRAIPVVFGTVKIGGGNTVWWGDLSVVAITQRVKSGLFSHKTITTGYRYYLGVQYALCQGPIDALVGLTSNNKSVPFSGSAGTDKVTISINAEDLFGGDTSEGGISGTITLYKGTQTQGSDAYLSAKQTGFGGSSSVAYSGAGNGGLSFVAPGTGSVNETITITALSTFDSLGNRQFSVHGSVSGSIGTASADVSFASSQINFTITSGSIPFSTGDHFTVTTSPARISPSFHGLCYAVLQHLYLGTSSYIKSIQFILRRCPDPLALGSSFANLAGDANPALAIYDLMTNTNYGLGISGARINPSSFTAAATTLKDEGLGISMQIDTQGKADDLIGDILRHCDGILYVDPQSGLWNLALARADYDPTTIPEITVDDIEPSPTFARASWSETTNQVIITYLDRAANFNTRSVQAQDPANINITGEVRTQTIQFDGLSNATTAQLLAMRVLKTLTYPLSKLTITVNRKAWNWRVAGVFKFTWSPFGIDGQIFRITSIRYGQLTDGKIELDAVEDIFGLNFAAFDPPPASGWTNPLGAPTAPAFQKLEECPLELIQSTDPSGIYAMTIIGRNDGTLKSYEVWQPVGGTDTETNEVFAFCPVGLLQTKYGAATPANDATGFTIQLNGVDLDALLSTDAGGLLIGTNLALIEEEIVSWETVTVNMDGTRTLSHAVRGCFDTVPVDHPAGALVYFFTSGVGLTQLSPYGSDLTVQAKILPKNNFGTFLLSSASYVTLATRSRYLRPYPPGDFTMQSQPYGTRFTLTLGDVVFDWTSRNRLTQDAGGTIVLQDAGDITPETGTTYTVKVTIGGSLVRTDSAIAIETYTYDTAKRIADGGVGPVTLQLFANANSLDSFQAQTAVFEMTGFGLDFGKVFGGKQA